MKTIGRLTGFAALAAAGLFALRRWQSARLAGKATVRAKPEPLQRWEGEGGALPQTGSHMGPDPRL